MSNNNKLKIDDLEILFDALKPNSNKSLPEALEKTITLAKQKGFSLAELQSSLDSCGIIRTDKLNDWLIEKF